MKNLPQDADDGLREFYNAKITNTHACTALHLDKILRADYNEVIKNGMLLMAGGLKLPDLHKGQITLRYCMIYASNSKKWLSGVVLPANAFVNHQGSADWSIREPRFFLLPALGDPGHSDHEELRQKWQLAVFSDPVMRALTEASEDIAKPEDVFQNCGDLVNLLIIFLEPHVNEDGEIIPIGMLVGYELISNDYGVHGLPDYGLHVLFVLSHLLFVCKCVPYFYFQMFIPQTSLRDGVLIYFVTELPSYSRIACRQGT